jgi:hypothetical protein
MMTEGSRETLADALLLRDRERIAVTYSPAQRTTVRGLVAAAAERTRAAALVLERHPTSALTLYREAARLLVTALLAAGAGAASADPGRGDDLSAALDALRARGLRPPVATDAFWAHLREDAGVAADHRARPESLALAEGGREAVAWLARLVEPRDVAELRFLRRTRLWVGGVATALVLASLGWLVAPRRNLALHKPVTVSGLAPEGASTPDGLTDGVIAGSYGVRTKASDAPWVQVDLKAPYLIDLVRIYNRGDEALEEGLPMTLQLSDNGRDFTDLETRNSTFGQTTPWTIKLEHRRGRYLRVRGLRGHFLALSELEAFGHRP